MNEFTMFWIILIFLTIMVILSYILHIDATRKMMRLKEWMNIPDEIDFRKSKLIRE